MALITQRDPGSATIQEANALLRADRIEGLQDQSCPGFSAVFAGQDFSPLRKSRPERTGASRGNTAARVIGKAVETTHPQSRLRVLFSAVRNSIFGI